MADEETSNCILSFTEPSGELLIGTVENEDIVNWSNGAKWERLITTPNDSNDGSWVGHVGTGTVGAAAKCYLMDTQFFKKVSKKDKCNFVIVVDRSAKMALVDETTR